MLQNIEKLLKDFSTKGVVYCHWKSNMELSAACEGVGDLDLLFLKSQYVLVTAILMENGFKRAESRIDRQFPGIEDYFGYDESKKTVVHLQAHYQLVTGQPLTKNHHFPVEKGLLENLIIDPDTGVPVPDRCLEAVLHVCRTFIKIGLKTVLRKNMYEREVAKAAEELAFLIPEGIDLKDEELIKKVFPCFSISLLKEGIDAIEKTMVALDWILLRNRFLRSMKSFERRGWLENMLIWIARRLYVMYSVKISGNTPKRRLATGGFGIAVVGSDGSGKSTAIQGITKWLGGFLAVKAFHFGRPKPGIKTWVASRLSRLIVKHSGGDLSLPSPGKPLCRAWPGSIAWIPSYLFLGIAKDRWRTYCEIRRYIGSGGIAVCDRFHLDGLTLMDSPRIRKIANTDKPYYRRLMEKEEAYYRKMQKLDLIFMLVVDPDTAARRQPGDGEMYVKERAMEILRFVEENDDELLKIDAVIEKDLVVNNIKNIIWESI